MSNRNPAKISWCVIFFHPGHYVPTSITFYDKTTSFLTIEWLLFCSTETNQCTFYVNVKIPPLKKKEQCLEICVGETRHSHVLFIHGVVLFINLEAKVLLFSFLGQVKLYLFSSPVCKGWIKWSKGEFDLPSPVGINGGSSWTTSNAKKHF